MALGRNFAATSELRLTGATVEFWTSSPSQSCAPTMTSGPLPTFVASLNCARTSVEIWTLTVTPFSWANWSAYFCTAFERSASVQMTRSTLASRTGAAVPLGVSGVPVVVAAALLVPAPVPAAVLDGVVGLDPPQALRARAATPVTAAAPSARLCMDSPLKPGGTRRHRFVARTVARNCRTAESACSKFLQRSGDIPRTRADPAGPGTGACPRTGGGQAARHG